MPFDPVQLDDVTKLLIEGRERIERGGFCKARFKSGTAFCTLGAIGWGERPSETKIEARRRLSAAVGTDRIPHWNDAPERTKQDILDAFDAAIAG
jgi:hypothetical protein